MLCADAMRSIADLCLPAIIVHWIREGRDVTDLPGLWDEGDLMKASVTP